MTQCMECSGRLTEAVFVFERLADDGRSLRQEVAGYLCSSCGEQVLKGDDAERISRMWYQMAVSRSPMPTVSTDFTLVPGSAVVSNTPPVKRILVSTSLP